MPLVKRITPILIATILVLSTPMTVWAQETTDTSGADPATEIETVVESTPETSPSSEPTTEVLAPTTPGPKKPPGPEANTYTHNKATGLWENDHYIWDPATGQAKPKNKPAYSYNPETGLWDTTTWAYSPESGKYITNTVSSPADPQNTKIASTAIGQSGPNSINTVSNNAQNNGIYNLFYDASISNTIQSGASTGNASVLGNTIAGSALTGNATSVATIINMLQSSWGIQPASDLITFMTDIDGDVTGDLYVDPRAWGPNSLAVVDDTQEGSLTVNASGSGLIDNDITVTAASGAATVENNYTAGNATSGNAHAVANVVNVINSAIAVQRSFLGVVNINGNLNGDILLPPDFLDQLIASNAPAATISLNTDRSATANLDLTNNQLITNEVNLGASSGSATVASNTNAGSATSGQSVTNLTIFNLTNRQVSAHNSILVFVNVSGSWVGLIMDAPAGSSAAVLGGGVTYNRFASDSVEVTDNTNNVINNTINVVAESGDALVQRNTNAGDATSGSSTASANIMNIQNSSFSLSGWFGMLFINVVGTWQGSFGVNTAAGNPDVLDNNAGYQSNAPTISSTDAAIAPQVFRFVAKTANHSSQPAAPQPLLQQAQENEGVLASTAYPTPPTIGTNAGNSNGFNWTIMGVSAAIMLALVGASYLPIAAYTSRLKNFIRPSGSSSQEINT